MIGVDLKDTEATIPGLFDDTGGDSYQFWLDDQIVATAYVHSMLGGDITVRSTDGESVTTDDGSIFFRACEVLPRLRAIHL
jgi:hypothetical protein